MSSNVIVLNRIIKTLLIHLITKLNYMALMSKFKLHK